MNSGARAPGSNTPARLPPEEQKKFDEIVKAGIYPAAKRLGISIHLVQRLMHGGVARREHVARVVEKLRVA